MPSPLQRFCPLCDRAFVDGEAVLRCSGCGVLHHPGCWVTNAGCGTQSDHQQNPIALAYAAQAARPQAPHPGEGTRTASVPRDPHPEPVDEFVAPPTVSDSGIASAIDRPPKFERPKPAEPGILTEPPAGRPVPPNRFAQGGGRHGGVVKPMPSIYRTHRLLRYWFIPAGLLVAAGVAFGVVWVVEQLFGGGDSPAPHVTEGNPPPTRTAPAATATPAADATQAPATPAGSPTQAPPPPGQKFAAGDAAVVDTGGDCLNVRPKASRAGDPIVCLADGAQVTVTGGPEVAEGFRWWRVKAAQGEGYAVEDFLTRK